MKKILGLSQKRHKICLYVCHKLNKNLSPKSFYITSDLSLFNHYEFTIPTNLIINDFNIIEICAYNGGSQRNYIKDKIYYPLGSIEIYHIKKYDILYFFSQINYRYLHDYLLLFQDPPCFKTLPDSDLCYNYLLLNERKDNPIILYAPIKNCKGLKL